MSIPQKPVIQNQEWINGETKLNQTNLTSGVNQNIINLKNAVDGMIDALGGPGSQGDVTKIYKTTKNILQLNLDEVIAIIDGNYSIVRQMMDYDLSLDFSVGSRQHCTEDGVTAVSLFLFADNVLNDYRYITYNYISVDGALDVIDRKVPLRVLSDVTTESNKNKVLATDNNGHIEWQTPAAPGTNLYLHNIKFSNNDMMQWVCNRADPFSTTNPPYTVGQTFENYFGSGHNTFIRATYLKANGSMYESVVMANGGLITTLHWNGSAFEYAQQSVSNLSITSDTVSSL